MLEGAMAEQPTRQFITLKELSKRSSLSIKTLRTFLYHQECPLPHYRMPRKILVDFLEFELWFQRFKVTHPGVDLGKIVNDIVSGLSGLAISILLNPLVSDLLADLQCGPLLWS
jgi:hypothetical protein